MTDTQERQSAKEDRDHSDTSESHDAPTRRTEPTGSEVDDIAPPLAALIASIRAAVGPNASPEVRSAGASACRSILIVLEAKPGQLLPGALEAPTPQSPLASLLSQPGLLTKLAAMSREQLLELWKQVSGAASQRTQSPTPGGPRFHLIQIPQMRRPPGT